MIVFIRQSEPCAMRPATHHAECTEEIVDGHPRVRSFLPAGYDSRLLGRELEWKRTDRVPYRLEDLIDSNRIRFAAKRDVTSGL